MRKLIIAIFLIVPLAGIAQSITGKWRTLDDNTGEEKSIVEISERGGKFYGKVIKIFRDPGEDPDPLCDECPKDDPRYKKKIIGLEIIQNMKKSGDEYTDGNILDPENGKIYRCRIWIENDDLKVRGYWGPFFRTQTWKRAT